MDCLRPPLSESPPGKWHCPMCPPLDANAMLYSETQLDPNALPFRDSSVASSSRSVPRYKNKGKGRAIFTDESEADLDAQESPSAVKGRAKQKYSRKGKARAISDDDDDDELPVRRQPKKVRMRVRSPSPPPYPRMVVRLRLPGRGKGKDREEEESRKGMFDDILGVEERDTSKTTVIWADKQRFERSRLLADVSKPFIRNLFIDINALAGKTGATPTTRPSFTHPRYCGYASPSVNTNTCSLLSPTSVIWSPHSAVSIVNYRGYHT
jgi:hypothetical protein